MNFQKLFPLFLIIATLTSSCSPADSAALTFLTKTATPPPTSTTVWFPPSATPSPQVFSTYTATPEMRPGIGDVFMEDDFTNPKLWSSAVSEDAFVDVSNGALTITIQPEVYYINLHQDMTLDNFYMEVTAHPYLCRGNDEYGVLVRGKAVAYYRFALTCNGQVHAERISVNEKHILQDPIPSGDVPPGAPGEVRIGVWALGNEMRLFLNGRYQFSITDQNYLSGAIGVFAHATSKDTPVTIGFTDLVIQDISMAPPTKTPVP